MPQGRAREIRLRAVAAAFGERFSVERMAADYLDICRSLAGMRSGTAPARLPQSSDGEALSDNHQANTVVHARGLRQRLATNLVVPMSCPGAATFGL